MTRTVSAGVSRVLTGILRAHRPRVADWREGRFAMACSTANRVVALLRGAKSEPTDTTAARKPVASKVSRDRRSRLDGRQVNESKDASTLWSVDEIEEPRARFSDLRDRTGE